jgi:hypothetical protein
MGAPRSVPGNPFCVEIGFGDSKPSEAAVGFVIEIFFEGSLLPPRGEGEATLYFQSSLFLEVDASKNCFERLGVLVL